MVFEPQTLAPGPGIGVQQMATSPGDRPEPFSISPPRKNSPKTDRRNPGADERADAPDKISSSHVCSQEFADER